MSKQKAAEYTISTQDQVTKIFLSVVAGGLVGATAALLFAPKAGHKLRKDIYHTYEDLSSRGQDFYDDAVKSGRKAARIAGTYAEDIKGAASGFLSTADDTSNTTTHLLIGAIGGGILGAAAIYLLSQKNDDVTFTHKVKAAGCSAAENLRSIDWMETAKEIVSKINDKVNPHHNGAAVEEEVHGKGIHVNDVIEWAGLGLQIWQNLKRRR